MSEESLLGSSMFHIFILIFLSNAFDKFCGRHTDLVGQCKKMPAKCLLIPSYILYDLHFHGFSMAELVKLTKMAGVMHEADNTHSIWSTW